VTSRRATPGFAPNLNSKAATPKVQTISELVTSKFLAHCATGKPNQCRTNRHIRYALEYANTVAIKKRSCTAGESIPRFP